jgi:nitrogen fixation/metabolism regulation signal transduction histidine kinase
MVYNKFYIAIIFQAILFAVLAYFSIWAQFREHLKFTGIGFGIMAIVSLVVMIFLVINHNNRIIRFLKNYIIDEPFPKFISPFRERTFVIIEQELNRIASSYSKVKLDKEAQHHLLNFMVEHIDTAILVMGSNGDIQISNKSANKFFPEKLPLSITDLKHKHPELYNTIISMKHGNTETVSIFHNKEVRQFLVKMTSFELKGSKVQLCSFDDVTNEMIKAEDRNWQKLLRILRHEIMNSVSPITSLASNLIDTYEEHDFSDKAQKTSPQVMNTFYQGLKAIDKRSKGLLTFVKSYKSLIEIPEPSFGTIRLKSVLNHLSTLYMEELGKDDIQLIMECNDDLKLDTNEELFTQVLVNLIRNAHESMQTSLKKVLKIRAERSANMIRITVADTGSGIADDHLEQIFIPFFTTKEKGAGIGLSLSRQIINRLGGAISVKSDPEGTEFSLLFNE